MAISLCILAYLLGSLSSAIILSRIFGFTDPREFGSKNPGTSNIADHQGKVITFLTFMGDFLKGFCPVLLASHMLEPPWIAWVALCSVIGHIYPIFFQFKGGKGIATAIGATFVLSLNISLGVIITWLYALVRWKYVSLASVITAATYPLWFLAFQFEHFIPTLMIGVLAILRHHVNIKLIRDGQEERIRSKQDDETENS